MWFYDVIRLDTLYTCLGYLLCLYIDLETGAYHGICQGGGGNFEHEFRKHSPYNKFYLISSFCIQNQGQRNTKSQRWGPPEKPGGGDMFLAIASPWYAPESNFIAEASHISRISFVCVLTTQNFASNEFR